MIDWIDEALFAWGIQRRRIDTGGREVGKGDLAAWHADGWPLRSIAGKAKDEGMGASHVGSSQHYAEVLTGDALVVSRALRGAPEDLQRVVYAHYVIPKRATPTKEKIRILGYKHRTAYYDDIHRAHVWVAARWDVPREAICSDTVAII
jgi:hypothetical protein